MSTSQSFARNLLKGAGSRINKMFNNPYKKANIGPFELKKLKHLPPGKLYKHFLRGKATWFYNPQEYLHGIKEIFVNEIYKQELPANAYILDCGSHIGLSVIYLKYMLPKARIVAFEPDKGNFGLLQKNITSHQLENVELRNEAVWNKDELLSFSQQGSMGSRITGQSNNATTTTVQAIQLKKYLTRRIDFLKLDIEGAEYVVLKDIGNSLSQVQNLFIEYHGSFDSNDQLTEIFNILSSNGFSYYIKEADEVYNHPYLNSKKLGQFDLQLNIFCFRK